MSCQKSSPRYLSPTFSSGTISILDYERIPTEPGLTRDSCDSHKCVNLEPSLGLVVYVGNKGRMSIPLSLLSFGTVQTGLSVLVILRLGLSPTSRVSLSVLLYWCGVTVNLFTTVGRVTV